LGEGAFFFFGGKTRENADHKKARTTKVGAGGRGSNKRGVTTITCEENGKKK